MMNSQIKFTYFEEMFIFTLIHFYPYQYLNFICSLRFDNLQNMNKINAQINKIINSKMQSFNFYTNYYKKMRPNDSKFQFSSSFLRPKIINPNALMFILSILFLFDLSQSQTKISINPILKTINVNTTYQFTIVDGSIRTITNSSAVIQLTFPSIYFSFSVGQTFSCFSTDVPSLVFPCRAININTIQMDNPLINTNIFSVSVTSIKNPASAQQPTFSYVFKYSNSTVISQATSDIFRNYSPGSLQSCTTSFTPSIVHSTSQIMITISLGNELPKNGSIYVLFPSQWIDSANSSFTPVISSLTQTCTKRSTGIYIKSPLTCTANGQQISLINSLNNTAPSGSILIFSINNILSPPTVFSGNRITVTTLTQAGNEIDKSTCLVDSVQSKSITGINLNAQFVVGTNTSLLFQFTAPAPISSNDKLVVLALAPNDAYFSLSTKFSGLILPTYTVLTGQFTNTTFVSLVFPPDMSTISASTSISLFQGFYLKPLISSGLKYLMLSLKRNGYEYASQSFSLSVTPNNLINLTISLDNYAVSNVAAYTFSFALANQLGAKSRILITLPSQLHIATGACVSSISAVSSPSSVNSSSTCSCSNGVISLGSVNLNTLSAGQRLSITVNSITNSQTTQPTGSFSVYTYYGQTNIQATDSSTGKTVQMSVQTIGVASVSSSSQKVADQATYTFTYTVKTKFLANSKIRIGLPSDVSIGPSLSAVYSILYANSTTASEQSCPIVNYTANSAHYLQLAGVSSAMLPALTIITMKISYLRNPSSLKPTSSFSINQIDSKGYEIQKLQASLILTNTQPSPFTFPPYVAESPVRVNGQTTIYSINFQSPVDLLANYFLLVQISTTTKDSQIYFSNPITTCDIIYTENNITKTVPNTFERRSSTLLKINLAGQGISLDKAYQLAINTIQRPRAAQTPSNISLKTFSYVSSSLSYAISSGTVAPLPNTKSNTIQSVSLNILTSPSQLFSYQSFSISVAVKNPLLSGDFVVVILPTQYTFTGTIVTVSTSTDLNSISSQSLCTQSQYFCSHFNSELYKIKVQQLSSFFSSTSSLTVTVKNNLYRSPYTFDYQGYYFTAITYTYSNLVIDETVSSGSMVTDLIAAQFYLTCRTNINQYHCKTCNSNGTCSSCYQPMNFSGDQYTFGNFRYLKTDFKCVSECALGQFINISAGSCASCDSPCATCSGTSTSCLSCLQTISINKYFAANKTCLTACPDGYYSDSGNICMLCHSGCKTCLNDPLTCLSCPNSTFLNPTTKTCVQSTSCPFGTYADSVTNKCLNCSVSCNGCSFSSFNCISCSTGYIVDFNNSTLKNCTNNCPIGKVNDTINGLGCRCQTQCKTCERTTSTCLSCDSLSSFRYFYSLTCLTTCPQGTYDLTSGGIKICKQCEQANCKACSATTCTQCSGQYLLYEGACITVCPTGSVMTNELGIKYCRNCLIGCVNCYKGVNECNTCESGYLKEGNSTNVYCTTKCSPTHVNFNNTVCYSSCPSGYENVNQICIKNGDNSTNNNTNSVVNSDYSQLSKTRTIPFPFTIASFIFIATILLSKMVLPHSLVSNLISALIGLLEPISWLIVIIVTTIQTKTGQHWPACQVGVYLLIISLVINMVLNVIALVFFKKYIFRDLKFSQTLSNNQKKVVLGKCPTITTIVLSAALSHKLLQLLFSNFLDSKHFSYKLITLAHIVPLNYVLYISLLPSALVVAGGSAISYELQSYATQSSSFIASVDMIIITLIGMVSAIWVTNRKLEDYEHDVTRLQGKHYQTQQILVQAKNGRQDDFQEIFKEVILEESGIRNKAGKAGKGKPYFYKSSRLSQRVEGPINQSQDNLPLAKKQPFRKPINQNNKINIRGSSLSEQQSSQALIINEKQRRRNLKDEFSEESNHQNKNNQKEDEIQIIQLQKSASDNFARQNSQGMPQKMQYQNSKQKRQRPEQLLKMSSGQKKELKQKIQRQLDQRQKQKLCILNRQKQLKIKKKKQKIEQILRMDEKQERSLGKEDKQKVTKIRQAVDLLKRKQIRIQEYLLYAQIINQEEGQYDQSSGDEQQISCISQKTNTIIKGVQDEDNQLQEVINLSPKRIDVLTRSIHQLTGNEDTNAHMLEGSGDEQQGQHQLRRADSMGNESTSKQKTVKKQKNTQSKVKAKHRKNNKHKINDLQVNYSVHQSDLNTNSNCPNQEYFYDSQKQPQLPKLRSNIPGGQGNKQRNRSQKQIPLKKFMGTNEDMMMIDVGSKRQNRQNRTQSVMGFTDGQLYEQHRDPIAPTYMGKVAFKRGQNNNDIMDRNVFDSENEQQTLRSYQHPDGDFCNQVSPSQFDLPNQRFFHVDGSSDVPVKPQIIVTINRQVDNQKTKKDGFDIYDQFQIDEDQSQNNGNNRDESQSRQMDSRMNTSMNRYSNMNHLDQNQIIRKNYQQNKVKQLEKIYLPRLQPKLGRKKTNRQSSLSRVNKNQEKY